ncbi:MAG: acyltransferase family protein [Halioglobus sp.]
MDKQPLYRPDIDGLRALAVLSVILFHFEFPAFSGGFVGVDVFFVISGFLITRLLVVNIGSGEFSFARFYSRRARRLFPALFFTLLATFVVAFFLLSPQHFARLGGSTLHALLAVSNYFFWSETGYFDIQSVYKPLLHTWSLAVEEQFYLVWPLLLFLLLSRCKHYVTPLVIATIGVISLLLSQHYLESKPDSTFYLAPFRAFEFAIGAMLVWLLPFQPRVAWVSELLFLLGLTAILYAVFAFDAETAFPGFNALVPTLGAALCIYTGTSRLGGCVLSNPIAVGIGLISYSLYLVHWPLYVLYKYYLLGELTGQGQVILVLASIVIAFLMYRFIETPFRQPSQDKALSPPAFGLACALCALVASLPAAHSWATQGWQWRVPDQLRAQVSVLHLAKTIRREHVRNPLCHMAKKGQGWEEFSPNFHGCNRITDNTTLVLGDSHAADMWAALHGNFPENNIVQLTGAGCVAGIVKGRCKSMYNFAEQLVRDNPEKITRIIYTQRTKLQIGEVSTDRVEATRRALESLATLAPLYWYGPQMEFQPDIPDLLARSFSLEDFETLALSRQQAALFEFDQMLAQKMADSPVQYISKLEVLCPDRVCLLTDDTGQILYPDYGHWTKPGGMFLARILVPELPQAGQ